MTLDEEAAELLKCCSEKNWDGYGAEPLRKETVDRALMTAKIVAQILPYIPAAEFAPCPDGGVDLDWWVDKDHLLNWGIDVDPNVSDQYLFHNGDETVMGLAGTILEKQQLCELLSKLYTDTPL